MPRIASLRERASLMIHRLLLVFASAGLLFAAESHGPDPDHVLQQLLAGNARYRASHPARPHQQASRRLEVAKAQHPGAIILGCSDSRVPPEVVFDQGIGDLFVIRMAGNVVDDDVLGTIEYAVEHLGSTLIVVLGHERCGAVAAAVQGGHAEGHIADLVKALMPAVEKTKGQPGDHAENAMRANVQNSVAQIANDEPLLKPAVEAGKVKIIGARYDLDTGAVEILR